MTKILPLRFHPIFRRYLWGGRRLATVLGKPIGDGDDYAESWELVDRGRDQSVVQTGPFQGRNLGKLLQEHGSAILGRHASRQPFPLLFKFLDAHQNLSVQVHPDDARAIRLNPPDAGKTEAWVILQADLGSLLFAGLQPGINRRALEQAIRNGTTQDCLHRCEALAGDCFFIPAGTVHALGAGLVVAEVQQSSDTTFRLFDWNRLGPDGKPRALHLAEALDAIDYERGPVTPQRPEPTRRPHADRLVSCDKFVLDRWTFSETHPIGGDDRCHFLVVIEGQVAIEGELGQRPLRKGETVLLSASLGEVVLAPLGRCVMLDVCLP